MLNEEEGLQMKILSIIFCCLFVSHQLCSQEVPNDVFEIFPAWML